MNDLKLSQPERVILEALFVAPDLPKIQDRARVILRAAEGTDDKQIAAELHMRRKDVLHWRKRFQAHGIRGLWDAAGTGPQRAITPAKEEAILRDVLYAESGVHWDAQQLALRHKVGRSVVYRVFAKHGIVRGRWGHIEIDRLQVLPDPLFGLTLSAILGLYYGTNGVLALVSTKRPFAELQVVPMDASEKAAIDGFVDRIHQLAEFRRTKLGVTPRFKGSEGTVFVAWLNRVESRREPDGEVCLLTDLPWLPPQRIPEVEAWLQEHPHFRVYCAPLVRDLCWRVFVRRWFSSITALPMQKPFLEDVRGLTKYLTGLSDEERRDVISVTHVSRH